MEQEVVEVPQLQSRGFGLNAETAGGPEQIEKLPGGVRTDPRRGGELPEGSGLGQLGQQSAGPPIQQTHPVGREGRFEHHGVLVSALVGKAREADAHLAPLGRILLQGCRFHHGDRFRQGRHGVGERSGANRDGGMQGKGEGLARHGNLRRLSHGSGRVWGGSSSPRRAWPLDSSPPRE